MKRLYIITAATCAAILLLVNSYYYFVKPRTTISCVRVGFLYNNDDGAPYSYNFSLAQDALEKQFGDRVETFSFSNVMEEETEAPLRALVAKGCHIIFTNNYSTQVMPVAAEFPDVTFCQTSFRAEPEPDRPANYHTFKGEAYQCRYVSGIAAGMVLRQLIDQHRIQPEEALVGYVAAFPTDEVISGCMAFLLGVRSAAPEALMRVRYTQTWSSYTVEKACTRQLIEEGCIVISQHTDTIGPAIACEEAIARRQVYYIGYNQDMSDVAPMTTLTGCRVNWVPYITGAVEAVMTSQSIEKAVRGTVHPGNDLSAGYEEGWVEVFGLNQRLAAYGTEEQMRKAEDLFRKGRKDFVFKGDYTGTRRGAAGETIDLAAGYTENERSSYPTFGYVLSGVATAVGSDGR